MAIKSYYTTNLNDPRVRRWYEAYKRRLGLPSWCPLSDAERHDFDAKVNVLLAAERAEEKTPLKEFSGA